VLGEERAVGGGSQIELPLRHADAHSVIHSWEACVMFCATHVMGSQKFMVQGAKVYDTARICDVDSLHLKLTRSISKDFGFYSIQVLSLIHVLRLLFQNSITLITNLNLQCMIMVNDKEEKRNPTI
jgi:hypothetical protein